MSLGRDSVFALLLFVTTASVFAEAPIEIVETVPPLSVETLYHPKDNFRYVASPSPFIRWSPFPGENIAIVKRDDGWKQIDPKDGTETDFASLDRFRRGFLSLDGMTEKKTKTIVDALLMNAGNRVEASLFFIDDSLGVAGTQVKPRWITRSVRPWREVTLSPDAKCVAYLEGNDLYVMHIESGRVHRISDDGSPTKLNGMLDWVYQEEVYGRGNYRAFWWRDDSSAIAFLRLDIADVPEFTFTDSRVTEGRTIVQRYPKAGQPIPKAQAWVAIIDEKEFDTSVTTKQIELPNVAPDAIITRVGWHPTTGELFLQVSNRLQNDVSLHVIDVQSPERHSVLVHEQTDKWLEVQELPIVLSTGEYVRLSDLPSGRRRLWKLSPEGSLREPMTPEDFDVREILFVDKDEHFAIVSGDRLRGTVGQQVYRVELRSVSDPVRLTNEIAWHQVSLSEDGKAMIDRESDLETPTRTWLRSLDKSNETNIRLHEERVRLNVPPQRATWTTIKTKDGAKFPGYVIFPFRENPSAEKFPVLVEVYGGPLAPTARDSWSKSRFLFHQMLVQEGIGVMVVDNRSSAGNGLADCWSIHGRMGELEAKDLETATDWLLKQPGVDAARIAIRGWSFGGYLTLFAMTQSEKYAVGIAGGNVTDWRNYDAIYTERYMGLPQENAKGYDATSPKLSATSLHGRVLMLHGEVDDNVHLANTIQMAGQLQAAGKTFEMMIYPGATHGVHEPRQSYQMMKLTIEFLKRELLGKK